MIFAFLRLPTFPRWRVTNVNVEMIGMGRTWIMRCFILGAALGVFSFWLRIRVGGVFALMGIG